MKPARGHALVLALIVVVVMMTALGLLASSMWMGMREIRTELATVSLIALTDAAMAETLAYLAEDTHFGGIVERDFGDGRISSEVRPRGARQVEVVARASYGGRRRSLGALIQLTPNGPRVLQLIP